MATVQVNAFVLMMLLKWLRRTFSSVSTQCSYCSGYCVGLFVIKCIDFILITLLHLFSQKIDMCILQKSLRVWKEWTFPEPRIAIHLSVLSAYPSAMQSLFCLWKVFYWLFSFELTKTQGRKGQSSFLVLETHVNWKPLTV